MRSARMFRWSGRHETRAKGAIEGAECDDVVVGWEMAGRSQTRGVREWASLYTIRLAQQINTAARLLIRQVRRVRVGPAVPAIARQHQQVRSPAHRAAWQQLSTPFCSHRPPRPPSAIMIDPSIRLRRAIHRNDLLLVRRIVRNHRKVLQNPDQRADSSLHVAAREGLVEIALTGLTGQAFLIDAGHEGEGFSRNADGDTALIVASAAGHEKVVHLVASSFPSVVSLRNKSGLTALMAAAKSGSDSAVNILLAYQADPDAIDDAGNTALHFASAYGSLKAFRTLLFASANPLPQNYYSWTPLSYSSTVQAEVYFENLLAERSRREVKVSGGSGGGGSTQGPPGRMHAGLRLVVDPEGVGQIGEDGLDSPLEISERAQTPTLGRSEKMVTVTTGRRMRASSGD
ncbi:MAG: hypothetical protein M1839_000197 [Geoglossum umbratile]|nr:MAG: hypothetical protein M1839_000197 [Geoglossum umbratile]